MQHALRLQDRHIGFAAELPSVLPTLARELGGKLDARSLELTRDLFWLGGEREDIPPRSAYGVGALIAADVLARRGLAAAVRLSGQELRDEVGRSLATLEGATVIGWSSVCAAVTFGE